MSQPTIQLIDTIPGLVTPPYSYAASSTGELVFFAGQVALDAEGKMVGIGDFAAQVKQAFANLKLALAAAGCTPATILKTNYYVVGLTRERLVAIREARVPFFAGAKPASTLIGVSMLFDPEALIEIEVIAARAR